MVVFFTLFPFIFIRGDGDERVINHESIHIAQYAELWVIGFLFLYALDYLRGYIKYWHIRSDISPAAHKFAAYKNIRFEQEAYSYEYDMNYLENRVPYAWRKYKI